MSESFVWAVLQVRSGFEERVCTSLSGIRDFEGLVAEVFVPPQSVSSQGTVSKRGMAGARGGKRIYAGYVFVRLIPGGEVCRRVLAVPYVLRFLMRGDELKIVSQSEIDAIRDNVTKVEEIKSEFMIGDDLKIISGPFESFCGVVQSVEQAAGFVTVVITIFGRPNPVRLAFSQVEKIDYMGE